jgi:hypothetical protein
MTTPQSPEIDMEAVREEEERKSEGFRLIGAFIFQFFSTRIHDKGKARYCAAST